MPKISVGLVTHNRPDSLKIAVDSILNQTFRDIELLLINNASPIQEVNEICEKYAKNDDRVKYLCSPENSIYGFRMAFENSTGDFYTQMDDDDYCELDMLEFLYNLAVKYDADISMCGSYRVINNKAIERYSFDKIMIMDRAEALDEFLKREICSTTLWSKLFKREKVMRNLDWSTNKIDRDASIVYKWLVNADRVVAHGIPKYYQVRKVSDDLHGYIGKHNLTPNLLDIYLDIYNDRTSFLLEKVPEIKERIIYSKWSFLISMCDKIYSYGLSDFDERLKIMENELKANYDEFYNCSFTKEFEKENLRKYILQKV